MGGEDFLAPMEPPSQRLSNSDFRKLMMTPRAGSGAAPGSATPSLGGVTPGGGAMSGGKTPSMTPRRVDKAKAEERRKKKTYYAKLKKDEDDKMAELASKYRDRAKERRDGSEGHAPADDANNAYRAVAPNAHGIHDAAERRKQMIHESKYLGGDMEHTHLVKGLDFALLQKVRAEIETAESAEVDPEEEEVTIKEVAKKAEEKSESKSEEKTVDDDKSQTECRTVMGRNITRLLFSDAPKTNELFMPGRMAYLMDLEEDGESDIPTTSIRSKKDVVNSEQKATLSTNDIVINKLTQILSYLRAGNRTKRKKKEKMEDLLAEEEIVKKEVVKSKEADVPIYDDVGDYKPSRKDERRDDRRDDRKKDKYRDDHRDRDRDRDRDRRDRDRDRDDRRRDKYRDDDRHRDRDRDRDDRRRDDKKHSYFDKPSSDHQEKQQRGFSNEDKEMIKNLLKREEAKEKQKVEKKVAGEFDGYAECYPGLAEMDDALADSDDEADFSKMDMGNKKGPVGRWDFDTQEEYADYMGNKEAMPKAAFQYGMKMSDGRKTRGKGLGKKNEKAALDREWNQIMGVINKRKGGDGGGSSKKQKHDDD